MDNVENLEEKSPIFQGFFVCITKNTFSFHRANVENVEKPLVKKTLFFRFLTRKEHTSNKIRPFSRIWLSAVSFHLLSSFFLRTVCAITAFLPFLPLCCTVFPLTPDILSTSRRIRTESAPNTLSILLLLFFGALLG